MKKTKKFIYLISPNKIKKSFYSNLKDVLSSNLVSFFQLRLKQYSLIEKKKNRVLVGIDSDKDAIEYGKKHFGNKIRLIQANASNLPFKNDEFNFLSFAQ